MKEELMKVQEELAEGKIELKVFKKETTGSVVTKKDCKDELKEIQKHKKEAKELLKHKGKLAKQLKMSN
uniref:Uncharacterized protein n=1 Tax=Maylandia zebra TaxID=106582 RepID=A0A3P9BHE8_9CICH